MPTTKLQLPTISGNETADIPRDLNGLAKAIDDKAGTANGLATLGADGKVPGSQLNVDLSPIERELAAHQADDASHLQEGERVSWNAKETPAGAQAKIERSAYSTTKSSKDAEGVFTVIEKRRKADDTLAARAVLSGGASPKYTTRTITYYESNGTTVAATHTFTLTYDADGLLVSEV